MNQTRFERQIRISGRLIFDTAFHIGTGREGELATDMGVLKDEKDWPVLPGSTLKGSFRAGAEKLASYLGLSACMLDNDISGQRCVGDQQYFRKVNETFKSQKSEMDKLNWLKKNTCNICQLFGSPLQASRIFFSDGKLSRWQGRYQVRDGVVIDRDSGTARPRLKYNFEVASRDTAFEICIDLENPEAKELAIVGAVLSEWQSGFRLGGFTSRGLGRVVLTNIKTEQVDYRNAAHLKDYLLLRRMQPADGLLPQTLQNVLINQGGVSC
ncbi:MAG: type III CRISPR-associated RAMP protein Csx7 [Thermodesulfobacteriota bacterium]